MESAKELLEFDFDPDAFARRALQPMKIRQGISDLLEKIVDECGSKNESPDQESPRQIYLCFIDTSPKKLFEVFDTLSRVRKLSRVLTYSDSESDLPRIVDNKSGLKNALRLIDHHFSIRAMLNIFDTLLKEWDTENAPMLQAFIKKHLMNYEGPRKLVLRLKSDMAWYCGNNGATQLAKHLSLSQINLADVSSYLGLPDSTQSYRYFGAVAEALIADNEYLKQVDNVKGIVDFLTKHNNETADRVILTQLIKRLGVSAAEDLRQPIQDYVLREWKDPRVIEANVHWHGVTNETWKIFAQWLMKEDLSFFYNVVLKKSERKDFWWSYDGKISFTRIVLGRNAESLFGNDCYYQKQKESMAKLKDSNRGQHALVIQTSHKTFIEFSTEDVCYVYDNINFSIDLSESEYDIQKLANNLQAKDRLIYDNTWRSKLASLIKSEVGIDLLPISRLGRR